MRMSYWRFAAMIATSTAVMFGLMYLNTYALEHVLWSETRLWMALLMGACMAVIMLTFMLNMYKNSGLNLCIYLGSVLVFTSALWLVRSQATINGLEYMQAMVPHHSIAVLTSERAKIEDPRVRKLADEIIEAQRREIAEMKYLIDVLGDGRDTSTGTMKKDSAELTSAAEALNRPNLSTIDPTSLKPAEVAQVIAGEQYCSFSYTRGGKPVLVAGPAANDPSLHAFLKLNGKLVRLLPPNPENAQRLDSGARFTSERIHIRIDPLQDGEASDPKTAHMIFEPDQSLRVGYRGWYHCPV